jgi:hypothetical protein
MDGEDFLIASHLGKYPKLMTASALLFEPAERAVASFEGFEGLQGDGRVSYEHPCQAINRYFYLETHARRIYSCTGTPEKCSTVELAKHLRNRKIGKNGNFTLREVTQKDWHALTNAKAVTRAIAILERAGQIRDVTKKPGPKGGRPSSRFEANPRIWDA